MGDYHTYPTKWFNINNDKAGLKQNKNQPTNQPTNQTNKTHTPTPHTHQVHVFLWIMEIRFYKSV